jgi:hypothetical protein
MQPAARECRARCLLNIFNPMYYVLYELIASFRDRVDDYLFVPNFAYKYSDEFKEKYYVKAHTF